MQTIPPKQTGKRQGKVRDHLTIRGREQLHAIGDPTRWRILGRLLESPRLHPGAGAGARRGEGHDRPPRARPRERRAHPAGRDDAGARRHREALPARRAPVPAARDARSRARTTRLATLPIRAALAEARPSRGRYVTPRRRSSCVRGCRRRARSASPTSSNQIAAEFADGAPGTGRDLRLRRRRSTCPTGPGRATRK